MTVEELYGNLIKVVMRKHAIADYQVEFAAPGSDHKPANARLTIGPSSNADLDLPALKATLALQCSIPVSVRIDQQTLTVAEGSESGPPRTLVVGEDI